MHKQPRNVSPVKETQMAVMRPTKKTMMTTTPTLMGLLGLEDCRMAMSQPAMTSLPLPVTRRSR